MAAPKSAISSLRAASESLWRFCRSGDEGNCMSDIIRIITDNNKNMLENHPHQPYPCSMSENLQAQYRRLQKQLVEIGWIARGSAYPRHYTIQVNGKPKCCGPYYCLTWKEDNKTRTEALSTEQYKLFSKAIANQRKLDRLLSKMRSISIRFIHQATQGVAKRNRAKSTKRLP